MKNKSLVAINDLSRDEIVKILNLAEEFEKNPIQNTLCQKVVATLFFEPSTRTRLSFESAVNRLGGRVIGFSEASNTSVTKGESLKDTILTVANYSDMIVMRHPVEGSARYASEISPVPIINAGDGANQHPTQTLLDLFSIRKTQGTLNNLNILATVKITASISQKIFTKIKYTTRLSLNMRDNISTTKICPILKKKRLSFSIMWLALFCVKIMRKKV